MVPDRVFTLTYFSVKYNLIDGIFLVHGKEITSEIIEIYPQLGLSCNHVRTAWKRHKDNLKKKKDEKELSKLERAFKTSCSKTGGGEGTEPPSGK